MPLSPLWLFFVGFCMGAAELIPGISGATVALLLGLWDELIVALASLRPVSDSSSAVCSERWPFVRYLPFFFWLLSGMALALLLLVQPLAYLLAHRTSASPLHGLFLGLAVASAKLLLLRLRPWRGSLLLIASVGAAIGYLLSLAPRSGYGLVSEPSSLLLFVSGALAAPAALLPGISGSYLLHVVGMYEKIIAQLASLAHGVLRLELPIAPLLWLFVFGSGLLVGAALSARVIQLLLRRLHDATLAALLGLMIGSLGSLWPFWLELPTNHFVASWPAWDEPNHWLVVLCFFFGLLAIVYSERYSLRKEGRPR